MENNTNEKDNKQTITNPTIERRMEKQYGLKGDDTDRFYDDEHQYDEWVNTYSKFISKLVEKGGLSSDY